jgi:hypothetical protein
LEQPPPPPDPSPRRDASPRAGPGPRREAETFLNPRASARREDGVAGVAVDDPGRRRVLFVSHTCYLDSNNGASVASRSMMESLGRNGFSAAAMSGTVLESAREHDPGECQNWCRQNWCQFIFLVSQNWCQFIFLVSQNW